MISQTSRAAARTCTPVTRLCRNSFVRSLGLGAAGALFVFGATSCGGSFDAATVATSPNATDVDLDSVTGTPTPDATTLTLGAATTPGAGALAVPNTTGTPTPLGLDLSGTSNSANVTPTKTPAAGASGTTSSGSTTTTTSTGSTGGSTASSGGSTASSGGSTASGGGSTASGGGSSGSSGSTASANRTETVSYTVQSGDALSVIAERYGVSASTIAAANGISPDSIRIGQVLTIPPPGTVVTPPAPTAAPQATPTPIQQVNRPAGTSTQYIVADGDKIEDVAKMHNVTVNAIAGANGLTEIVSIYSGACLIIPPSGSTTSERITPTAALCGGGTPTATTPTPQATPATPEPTATPASTATPDPNATPTATADPNATPDTSGEWGQNFREWKPGEDPEVFRQKCTADGGTLVGQLSAVCDLPG